MLLSINENIHNKPLKPGGRWFANGFLPKDITQVELANQIMKGNAFSAQFAGGRRSSKSFSASGFIAADVDSGLTLEQAQSNTFITENAAFLYTTSSHKPKAHRFRVVFELQTPITDERRYRSALLGLIARLGSDESCKDGARLFYGNSRCKIIKFGKTLSDRETDTLVQQGRVIADRSASIARGRSELSVDDSPSLVFDNSFSPSLTVTHRSGKVMDISVVPTDDRGIFCPFHLDNHPSAYIVVSKNGDRGIACHVCGSTRWPAEAPGIEFNWHKEIIESSEVSESQSGGPWQSRRHKSGMTVDVANSRYLPPLQLTEGVTYIRSPKGTGKTEALSREVKRLLGQGKRILLVGHRRSLLGNLAQRLGLPNYENEPNRYQWREQGSLAVSVDSLANFVDTEKDRFDLLLIDESEQVTAHFKSETLSDRRTLAYMTLEFYLKSTPYIVCSDADAGEMTAGLLTIAKNMVYPDRLILNQYKVDSKAPRLEMFNSEAALLSELKSDLIGRRKCFVATNSKSKADGIYASMPALVGAGRALLITSGTTKSGEAKKFLNSPNIKTSKYDLVVYSPSLSTGVDINFDGKIVVDSVFGFFQANITTHFEIDQQLSRVRDPGSIKVWISAARYRYQTDPLVLAEEMKMGRDLASRLVGIDESGKRIYRDDSLLSLIAWITAVQRSSMSDLRSNFINLRKENGFQVEEIVSEPAVPAESPGARPDMSRTVAGVLSAKKITKGTYEDYLRHSKKGLSKLHEAQVLRYEMDNFYRIPLNEDLILRYLTGRFRRQVSEYRNLMAKDEQLRDEDAGEMLSPDLSSLDWKKKVARKRLLSSLFTIAGIFDESTGFISGKRICKHDLKPFIDAAQRSQTELAQMLDCKTRADIATAPMLQLRELLKLVGLSMSKANSTRTGNMKTVWYELDMESSLLMQKLK